MTTTATTQHPTWCVDHVPDDDPGDGYCQSAYDLVAGSLKVGLTGDHNGRAVYAEIVRDGGKYLEIFPEEIAPLIAALQTVKAQIDAST